ncbi:Uncharacterized protein APZ42_000047 [Daphnia magna]|uniref:Uncharacterized protein n=1 Tax=Daphnia magna TaxID=35525 RepID=A0A164JYI3_9CRUS|nr:Uncharacterized protein APZ42_000047 [Daphnia magna]
MTRHTSIGSACLPCRELQYSTRFIELHCIILRSTGCQQIIVNFYSHVLAHHSLDPVSSDCLAISLHGLLSFSEGQIFVLT